MTNAQHTPGPWWYAEDMNRGYQVYSEGGVICRGTFGEAPAICNGNLIAAAPELLEALETIAAFDIDADLEWKNATVKRSEQRQRMQEIARIAIAKVKGAAA